MATAWRPADWPPPNLVDPPTRGKPVLFILTSVLTAVVVALRMYSRGVVTRSLGVDDALLVAGFVLSIGQTFAEYMALTRWGWNMHLWDVPVDRLQDVRLAAWLTEIFFLWGNACTKISILLVYRKITAGSQRYWFVWLTWSAIAFTVGYTAALGLELFLVCRPLRAYWRSNDPRYTEQYRCGNEHVPLVFSAAASVCSDVYSSVLPMLMTSTVRLSRRQRLGLWALFSVGFLTAGVGVARLYFLVLVTTNYRPGPKTHDVTWFGWTLFALTDVEAHLAIACASAPALRVLFRRRVSGQLTRLHGSVRSHAESWRRRHSRGTAGRPPSCGHDDDKAPSLSLESLEQAPTGHDTSSDEECSRGAHHGRGSPHSDHLDTNEAPAPPRYLHIAELQKLDLHR